MFHGFLGRWYVVVRLGEGDFGFAVAAFNWIYLLFDFSIDQLSHWLFHIKSRRRYVCLDKSRWNLPRLQRRQHRQLRQHGTGAQVRPGLIYLFFGAAPWTHLILYSLLESVHSHGQLWWLAVLGPAQVVPSRFKLAFFITRTPPDIVTSGILVPVDEVEAAGGIYFVEVANVAVPFFILIIWHDGWGIEGIFPCAENRFFILWCLDEQLIFFKHREDNTRWRLSLQKVMTRLFRYVSRRPVLKLRRFLHFRDY